MDGVQTYPSCLFDTQQQVASSNNAIIVFVHGFGSTAKCWDSLIELFHEDPCIGRKFDLDRTFQYPASWFSFSPLKRIPRLQELADFLRGHLNKASFANHEITLVGHSLGGLVIQAYLAKALRDGRGAELRNIRQVVFIATPHRGSETIASVRNLLTRIFENPLEKALRVLNPEIDEIVEEVKQRITGWPIVVRCFWGMQDRIVPEASGRGSYSEASPLPGDHFSILRPPNREDPRYVAITEAIRDPIGHREIFEIDLFDMAVAVEPLSSGEQVIQFGRHNRSKVINSDNKASIIHRVSFSRNNRCIHPFKMCYRTRNNGVLVAHTSHPNIAEAQELGRHDDYGCEHLFKFTPKPGLTYEVQWEVYRGFDAGNRDIHFHFNKPETRSHYRKFHLRLDLSAYLSRSFLLTMVPMLYYHTEEPNTCEECRKLPFTKPLSSCFEHDAGIWEWELNDVRQGVLTVRWDMRGGPSCLDSKFHSLSGASPYSD